MSFELTVILIVLLALLVWRAAHRRRRATREPFPDIGDAPASADPAFVWRYVDDGLYSRYLDDLRPHRSGGSDTDRSIN